MHDISKNAKALGLFYSMWGLDNKLSRSAEKVLVNNNELDILVAIGIAGALES